MSGVYRWCYQWPGVTVVMVVCVLCMLVSECRMDPAAVAVAGTAGETTESVCTLNGCNCTTEHKYWTIVNCSLDSKQIVELHAGILPEKTIELSITGGQEVKLHAHLFTDLKGFQRLRTDGTRNVVIKKHAFLNLTVNSLLVQLDTCTSLVFETSAFKNMKGPVTIKVARCGDVRIQASVFSFLQDATFQDILRLELAKEAFALPPREIGRHGPVTTIKFRKVMIPSIPTDTFKSSLVEVNLVDSEVREVQSEAFSGNTIVAVKTMNTSLHLIRSRAFSERTLMDNLIITNCRLHKMESEALHSAVTNLTIQHSKINTVNTGAINTTIATVVIQHNEIDKLHSKGFSIHDWNRMNIDNNIFHILDEQSFDSVQNSRFSANHDQYEFSFTGNQVGEVATGALRFFSDIMPNVSNSRYDNNFFTYPCLCEMDKWLALVIGESSAGFATNNFCAITTTLAQCYDTAEGRMNMRNFTDTYCGNGEVMKCKTFSADANVGINQSEDNSNLILGLILGLVLLIAVCGTVVILLIHGGLWLKRKGYCVRFRNFNYRAEEESTEAEDIMVAVDRPAEHIPEELTQDLLQALREKLEDPTTYNEAREMIERLYDHFIIEDSYTNNNRQEEETHLYEELGNLPPANADLDKSTPTRPFSFLRLIEERFNLNPTEATANPRPSVLADEYSEPKDAQVHLYSELPQNGKEGKQNEINESITNREQMNNSLRSTGSGRMAYRPLPDKPKPEAGADPGEGPSTKF